MAQSFCKCACQMCSSADASRWWKEQDTPYTRNKRPRVMKQWQRNEVNGGCWLGLINESGCREKKGHRRVEEQLPKA